MSAEPVRSFRFKIALWSTSISGLVLLLFALLAYFLIGRIGQTRIDREILTIGQSYLRAPRHESTRGIEGSLRFLYGGRPPVVLQLWGPRQEVAYQSENWPALLDGVAQGELGKVGTDPYRLDQPDDEPLPRRRPPRPPGGFPGLPGGLPPRDRDPLWERDGPQRDGPQRDGPQRDGPLRDGPLRDGPLRDGPLREGPFRDRQALDPLLDPNRNDPPPPLREPVFGTVHDRDTAWRYVVVGHERVTAVVGMDLQQLQAERSSFRNAFLIATPLALALLAAGGFFLAQRALRPVTLITEKAARIQARGLHERIPEIRSDREFAELIEVINGMLQRLERSFHQAARFSADAAHELKTPLTILQGQLEQAVQEAEEGSAAQRTFAELLVEVQRLRTIIRKLLLLAQADAGRKLGGGERIDLSAMVSELADDLRELAPTLAITTRIDEGVEVRGDGDLLRQLLQNLGLNAIKFNAGNSSMAGAPEPGAIEIEVRRWRKGEIRLVIANSAKPISQAARERLFERFYRGDAAHSRQIDGTGLGLSLAREIAVGHGGRLELGPERPGWVVFVLTLPGANGEALAEGAAPPEVSAR